jgi:serpin B
MMRSIPTLAPVLTLAITTILATAGPADAQAPVKVKLRGAPTEAKPEDAAQLARAKHAAEDVNAFAFELYRQLREDDGNIFLSPYSIHTALGMTAKGAAGNTANQMLSVLDWATKEDAAPHARSSALIGWLNERQGEKLRLSVANALWVQDGYPIKAPFTRNATKHYNARVAPLDFRKQTEKARETINAWVADRTEDKIENLMPEGSIQPMTRVVLTNAVYFKGGWVHQFNEDATNDQPFTLADGESVKAPLMFQTDRFRYAEFLGGKAVQLPYKDGPLEMVVLLPNEPAGLAKLEEKLSPKMLEEWLSAADSKKVKLWLPKFESKWKKTLNETLAAMGMPDAFTRGKADFSGITDAESLFIDKVIHQSYVAVDETGTEAAAATGIAIRATSAAIDKPAEFKADHPFLYLIRDRKTGAILFLGRMLDPR